MLDIISRQKKFGLTLCAHFGSICNASGWFLLQNQHSMLFMYRLSFVAEQRYSSMNFLNRARILIIKFNDLEALSLYKTIQGLIIDQSEDVCSKQNTKRTRSV